jgi:hypothetical protein
MYYEFDIETKEIRQVAEPLQLTNERNHERFIASDYICDGKIHVSTVFLVIDHSFLKDDSAQILFETMIFGLEPLSDYQERCSTYEQALQMHQKALDAVYQKK